VDERDDAERPGSEAACGLGHAPTVADRAPRRAPRISKVRQRSLRRAYDHHVANLLVVEDDEAISQPLVRTLIREGHEVAAATSGEAALELAGESAPDLVVLDVGLPGIDGIEVCRRLSERRPRPAILMLTARSSELDEVLGLDAGADDYLIKPFTLAVLTARVRALLRRGDTGPAEAGGVRIDPAARRAWRDGQELELSPKEFDLLELLVGRAGEAVRREEIMDRVWDENWWGPTKTLDTHIGWLRRKLGDPDRITTVRGVGFRFEP
jgi:DNA-binding response OmpR family regulator